MVLSVQSTQDAYVYCYYQDSKGTVARIFPNRFQPDSLLHAGVQIQVPQPGRMTLEIPSVRIELCWAITGSASKAYFPPYRERPLTRYAA